MITALLFGVGNYTLAKQSGVHGIKASLFQAVPYFILCFAFHIVKACIDKKSSGQFFPRAKNTYFVKNDSGEYKLSCARVAIPFIRSLFNIAINGSISTTFYFAAKSNVNSGIIACNFSSGLVFVAIIFYFKYGQKMFLADWVGSFFIVLSVILIALGGSGNDEDAVEIDTINLVLAIVFGLITGLVFALNGLNMKYYGEIPIPFPAFQMIFDANFCFGLYMFPFFLYYQTNDPTWTFTDSLQGAVVAVGFGVGLVTLALGFRKGKGGTVQAIDNTKNII